MTKSVRRFGMILGIVLGLVLLLLVSAALFLESAWMRGWLEDRASTQLGRDVEIGDHDIAWGLPLTLRLDEVRVADVDWADDDTMASVDELALTLNVPELLQGRLELERVEVNRPEIRLLRREDGTTNWDDLLDEEPTQEQEIPLWPKVFVIEQGLLTYRDDTRAIDIEVAFETPGESVDELSLELDGEGSLQDDPVAFQGLAHVEVEERRGDIEDFEGRIGESRLEGTMSLDLGREVPRLVAELEADALDLNRWGLTEPGGAEQRDQPEANGETDADEERADRPDWDRRIGETLEGLESFEADLDLALGRLRYGDQTLHDLTVVGTLEEGRLTIEQLRTWQQVGEDEPRELNLSGWLEVDEQRLVADLQARFERLDLTAALAPFGLGRLGTLEGRLETRVVNGGLVFEDTELDYRAPHWGLTLALRADSRNVEGEGEHRVHLVGDGTYEGEPFAFDLLVGPLLDLTDDETPYPVSGEVTSGETHLALDGSVVQPFALEAVEGNLTLEGPSPADITELTGINLPELPPYRVSGYLRYRDDLLNLSDMEGTFGDSDVAGDVRLRFGELPKLWATLTSEQLEADDLLPMLGMSPDTDPGETASAEQQRWEAEEQQGGAVFPDREWDLEALRGTDIVLEYEAADVQAKHIPFTDMALTLELERGVMTVDPLQVGLGGGEVRASWYMDARQAALEGNLELALDQVNLKALLDEAGLPDVAEDTLGTIGGRGNMSYHGRSMHEVMAGLDGELELAMSQGWMDIIAAELLPLNVANALLAALADEEQVRLECSYAHLVADDGLVDLSQFFMATEIAHFMGAGAINLETERMDLAFEGHNKDPTLFTGNSPVTLKGSLREPEVDVVTRELLARGALSALGALVAPPLAILPWVDPGGGEEVGMGCERALSQFEE
ncbi:AsmA family protein [Billgrantia saliphila]|uniref:AsmA family protein n=1 Tax=Billgrantia saliphila TaxID=1848458 RepID=UPI0018CC3062|nr:AsmA family protein [Halomonas saliphila]